MILPLSFYQRPDVVQIGKELLGKYLFTEIGGCLTGGMIIETESYGGAEDRACHAYGMRRTKRTEVMFQDGGVAYVYLCYGIHFLLNVVTHTEGVPEAVLLRALYPTHGLEAMQKRRKRPDLLCSGPGALCQALGITSKQNGLSFASTTLWIEDRGVFPEKIASSTRVGVEYAKEDALRPWRFSLENPTPFL